MTDRPAGVTRRAAPGTSRAERRRRLGVGLVAFGATGIALVLAAAVLVLGSLSAVDDAATGFERQRAEIVAMLGPASQDLSDAATSATNASGSLTETSAAADRAAVLTTRLAESFDGLASLGSFEVLGARPFGQLSGQFTAVASDARSLSADLTAAAARMRTNVTDSDAVAADLRSLAEQLDRLETSLGGAATSPGGAGGSGGIGAPGSGTSLPVAAAGLVLLGLLVWFAVPAVVSLWLGWRLLRPRVTHDRRA